jgi:hypothetical protein
MRYRITNLTHHTNDTAKTENDAKRPTVDLATVQKAVACAAARGERLYIKPVAATAQTV